MSLPSDLINPLTPESQCVESLFTYFLSTCSTADFQAVSVLGIPEGISQMALVKRCSSGRNQTLKPLKYSQPEHQARMDAFGAAYNRQFAASDQNYLCSITSDSS